MFDRRSLMLVAAGCLAACGGSPLDAASTEDAIGTAAVGSDGAALQARRAGERLFEDETFHGNGRTCATCHGEETGTLSPANVQRRLHNASRDPLFRSIDSDDGVGSSYTRLLQDATIRIPIALPDSVKLQEDPAATTVVYNRGIPTVRNIALDPVLMQDGRQPDLQSQAAGAIHDHAQGGPATQAQLDAIAAYERTLFSSEQLERYYKKGTSLTLPAGRTASEQRGRAFFTDSGLCGQCHGGQMLNQMTDSSMFGPPGTRFSNVFVSELNAGNQPVHTYQITIGPDTFPFDYTDLGRFLITGDPNDVGAFKIPTLWGIRRTAPYFHDNSSKTLADVVNHYAFILDAQGVVTLSDQDKADMVAYMNLL